MPPKDSNTTFELKSGAVDAFQLILKSADFGALRGELAARFGATPDFFGDDAVIADLRRLPEDAQIPLADLAELLQGLRLRLVGTLATDAQRAQVIDAGFAVLTERERRAAPAPAPLVETAPAPQPQSEAEPAWAPTTVIDKPLRSGQRVFAEGDLVVLAVVSHGAEIIAGGNIHVYAPLRGRALAGVAGRNDARIFCTCMEPELISIAGIYRTVETDLPKNIQGKPAQVRLDGERLIVEPLELR